MKMRLGACLLVLAMCGCSGKKIADSNLYDVQAALPAGLPYPVLEWKAITTAVDREAGTTSTLFGNDAAVDAARAGVASPAGPVYPAGAVLGLVTWQQQDDPHWFGARIPGTPMTVEFVLVGASGERKFVGSPWREVAGDAARVAVVEGMKAAVAP